MDSDDRHELAIRRLMQMAGPHGQVTLDQIKSVLPIDEMTPEEIGRVIMQLEQAGVEVQLDEDLLHLGSGPANDDNVVVNSTPVAPDLMAAPRVSPTASSAAPTRNANPSEPAHASDPPRRPAFLMPALVVALVLLGVALLYAVLS